MESDNSGKYLKFQTRLNITINIKRTQIVVERNKYRWTDTLLGEQLLQNLQFLSQAVR